MTQTEDELWQRFISGPALIGALLAYYFMGFYSLQLYRHVHNSTRSKDGVSVHIVVALTTVLELVQLICVTLFVFELVILHPGDPAMLQRVALTSAVLPALNGSVAFLAQSFRLWHIHSFINSIWGTKYVCPLIFLLCLCQCGTAIGITTALTILRNHVENLAWLKTASITWLTLAMASDTLITATIVVPLLGWKACSGFDRSRRILTSLILKAIESGSITVLFAIPHLVVYVKYEKSMLGSAFQFIVGGLYANVLLATLNGRERVRHLEGDMTTRPQSPWIMDGEPFSFSGGEMGSSSVTVVHNIDPA